MFKTLIPPDETAVDEQAFREALGRFASGVTVITTEDEHGKIHGMTATAFCSLSLSPPLVLVAIARGTTCHRRVLTHRRFGVSILHAGQAHVSRHFGGKPSPGAAPEFGRLADVPVLADAMVRLACRLEDPMEGGDHSIFIGLVTAIAMDGGGEPLLHFDGGYHAIATGQNL